MSAKKNMPEAPAVEHDWPEQKKLDELDSAKAQLAHEIAAIEKQLTAAQGQPPTAGLRNAALRLLGRETAQGDSLNSETLREQLHKKRDEIAATKLAIELQKPLAARERRERSRALNAEYQPRRIELAKRVQVMVAEFNSIIEAAAAIEHEIVQQRCDCDPQCDPRRFLRMIAPTAVENYAVGDAVIEQLGPLTGDHETGRRRSRESEQADAAAIAASEARRQQRDRERIAERDRRRGSKRLSLV
jgi:hypothetical protein